MYTAQSPVERADTVLQRDEVESGVVVCLDLDGEHIATTLDVNENTARRGSRRLRHDRVCGRLDGCGKPALG